MEGGWRTSSLNHLPEVFKRISSHVQDPSHTTTIIIPLVLEAGSAPIVSGCYCTLLSEASTVGQITVHTCLLLRLLSTRWYTAKKSVFGPGDTPRTCLAGWLQHLWVTQTFES